jgi:hypothetical protein
VLKRIDDWIAEGILGGEPLNAAERSSRGRAVIDADVIYPHGAWRWRAMISS